MATEGAAGAAAGGCGGDRAAMLFEMLEAARDAGFLGPGDVHGHIEHARGFPMPATAREGPAAVDLGAGAGVPGLILALDRPEWRWSLVEAGDRRATFLRRAAARLGVEDRVRVVHDRAERVGRSEEHRGRYDVVVARGFGPPAPTAECAAPLLRVGGFALVSDPPASCGARRWPTEPLADLGLAVAELRAGPPAMAVLQCVTACPARFPRRDGVPRRRPLWRTELFHVEPSRTA